jgi:tetratricopeptide (TPR) repeat protein
MVMKKSLILIAVLLLTQVGLYAQDFNATLAQTVHSFFTGKDNTEKINSSNKLTLISKKFSEEWSASYYAALSKIMLSYEEHVTEKKDAYVDEAEEYLNKATTLCPKDNKILQSEIYTLTAMVANARLAVNPMKRWQKYGKIFDENLEKAKENNADNPRIYFLKGTATFYTPKMVGGGKKKALTYFEKANALFEKEKKGDILSPYWGKEANDEFMKMARQED